MEQREHIQLGSVTTENNALDPEALASLRSLQEEGEPDVLQELVDMFLADAEPRLASLREAVARGDGGTVEKEAHALKGSCANFGAHPMAALCQQLQASGRSGDLADARDLLERLDQEYGRVCAALNAELSKG